MTFSQSTSSHRRLERYVGISGEGVSKACNCLIGWVTIGGMEPRKPYPTDLTDQEWALRTPDVPAAKPGGRSETYPTREILNGILYILRGGWAWRLLPHDCPPGSSSTSMVGAGSGTGPGP
jgi:hypothetical protein